MVQENLEKQKQREDIGKKTYMTTYKGGGTPPIIKKYKILRCNTPKFRTFVVVTAFLWNRRREFLNKYKILSFYGLAKSNIGKKPYLTTYQGGPPILKNTKYCGATPRNCDYFTVVTGF